MSELRCRACGYPLRANGVDPGGRACPLCASVTAPKLSAEKRELQRLMQGVRDALLAGRRDVSEKRVQRLNLLSPTDPAVRFYTLALRRMRGEDADGYRAFLRGAYPRMSAEARWDVFRTALSLLRQADVPDDGEALRAFIAGNCPELHGAFYLTWLDQTLRDKKPPRAIPLLLRCRENAMMSFRLSPTDADVLVGRESALFPALAVFAMIGRRHCRLRFYDGVWHVTDLGSRNGTTLIHEGERIRLAKERERPLLDGDGLALAGVVTLTALYQPDGAEGEAHSC